MDGIPDPIVADLVSATRKNVLQKASHELERAKRHGSPLALCTPSIAECDLTIADADQPAVRKGNAVDVPCEVLQNPFRAVHRRPTVNPPSLSPDDIGELVLRQCLACQLQEYSAEDIRKCLDRNQVVLTSG